MIDLKELRIGNLLRWKLIMNSGISVVKHIEDRDNNSMIFRSPNIQLGSGATLHECQPIELTSEWLEKLGFKQEEGDSVWENCKLSSFEKVWWIPGMYFLEESDEEEHEFRLYYCTDEDTYMELCIVKYVHKLQNIIYELSGEELNIIK